MGEKRFMVCKLKTSMQEHAMLIPRHNMFLHGSLQLKCTPNLTLRVSHKVLSV